MTAVKPPDRREAAKFRPTSRSASNTLPPAARLKRNQTDYARLVELVHASVADGDADKALLVAAFAAHFASKHPTGRLVDWRLESLVARAVRGEQDAPTVDTSRANGQVLHVITEASGVDGQSKTALRWIDNDPTSADVAITHQAFVISVDVRNVVEGAGGYVHNLRKGSGSPGGRGQAEASLQDRAVALRAVMDEADLVVAHTMPHDPVLLAAASLPGARPPIITKNFFADRFWLGASVTDVLANPDRASEMLSTELRGVATQRQQLVPLPVGKPAHQGDRANLRGQMLFGDNDVVAICVADTDKLEPVNGLGFADVVARLLKSVPRLSVILVGPTSHGRWKQLALRYPGRIHALGELAEAQAIFPVADLYLDSYPHSGRAAVLDAAASGLPVVGLSLPDDVTLIDPLPALTAERHRAHSLDSYTSTVRALARSTDLRDSQGADDLRQVRAVHSGAEWQAAVENIYQRCRSVTGVPTPPPGDAEAVRPGLAEKLVAARASDSRMRVHELIAPYATLVGPALREELTATWLAG